MVNLPIPRVGEPYWTSYVKEKAAIFGGLCLTGVANIRADHRRYPDN